MLLPDGTNKPPQLAISTLNRDKKPQLTVGTQTKKAIRFFKSAFYAVCSCYALPEHIRAQYDDNSFDTELDDLPPEVLMKIIGYCDFSSQMHLRATSRRMHSLVEHSDLARRQVIGGVEIGTFSLASASAVALPTLGDDHEPRHVPLSASSSSLMGYDSSDESESDTPRISLRRLSRRHGQIVLSMERLKFMMRRLCVCHSVHIRGVSMDDLLASRLLMAEYRAVRDLVVDRVSTVSEENLLNLVQKVCPTHSIYVFNHSTRQSTATLTPSLVLRSATNEIAIEAAIGCTYIHSSFDDESLQRIVVHDALVRRSIRLPLSMITHAGIIEAARVFQCRCLELLEEFPDNTALWELIITLPVSPLIDPSRFVLPSEMLPHTRIYFSSMPSVVVEVLINRMNLRIHIDYGVRK